MLTTTETKDLMKRFEAAMNARDLDALDALVAPDVVRHCEATPALVVENLDQLKDFLRVDAATFPDNVQTFEHIVVEDDQVGLWARYAGTQEGPMGPFPASGKRADFHFGCVFRMADDRIAEWWVTWDNMTILGQLGHLSQ
jgi:steroid delta-isomerase-like uncharacterized protein